MRDPRLQALAKTLVQYSTDLQKGEKIWINMSAPDPAMVEAIVEEVYRVGGLPFVTTTIPSVESAVMAGMTEELAREMAKLDLAKMNEMDAYIAIRNTDNLFAGADVPPERQALFNKLYSQPVHIETRVPKTKWVVLRYPSHSMAQQAGMSTRAFEDFYFSVCNVDYEKMSRSMDPLVERFNKAKKVRITGEGTDITFSVAGMPGVKCCGRRNIPDGEVYTAPVRDSVNGVITYNTPAVVAGFRYENIRFRFENGKIVEATANDSERLNRYLDTDEGARYIGEFSIGCNPNIKEPMCDTLFDEKISGSIHFTPGNAYESADNGNRSALHWDLVMIQRPEYGGGCIYFDDELIRKDGRFVVPDLEGLNEEQLR